MILSLVYLVTAAFQCHCCPAESRKQLLVSLPGAYRCLSFPEAERMVGLGLPLEVTAQSTQRRGTPDGKTRAFCPLSKNKKREKVYLITWELKNSAGFEVVCL